MKARLKALKRVLMDYNYKLPLIVLQLADNEYKGLGNDKRYTRQELEESTIVIKRG